MKRKYGLKEIFPNLLDQVKRKLTMTQETEASNWPSTLLI